MRPQNLEELEIAADRDRVPMYISAIHAGTSDSKNAQLWPEPVDLNASTHEDRPKPELINDNTQGLLAEMARDIAKVVKFPVNTAYLHALGVAACAMTKSFKYQYGYKPKPVTLYICTAQPPSSGKSGVNDILLDPVRDAYIEINKKNKKRRRELQVEIRELEKSLAKADLHEAAYASKSEMLDKAIEELEKTPIWQPTIKDATIEAAESTAKNQTGMINIVSDEAEAINTIFGNTYTREGSKSNFGLLLSAWDGDMVESVRVGREAYIGRARSTISVLAQDDSVESILRAGATGRGLAERFLLLAEKSLLGERNHLKNHKPDFDLRKRYEETMINIVNQEDIILTVDDEGIEFIAVERHQAEKEMSDCGKYEHNLITGFVGKMDKQIIKIACVLHVIEHWQTGGSREKVISWDTVVTASGLFSELSKTYINAADSMGYVGERSEITILSEVLTNKARKGELSITIRKLVNDIKNKKPFNGMRNITKKLKEQMLPKLQDAKYCYLSDKELHINPRLK